jgi:hypothetical protein
MISNIFWDLDECMIRASRYQPDEPQTFEFPLDDGLTYHVIVRPSARDLFSYSRALVGKENVYILTAATQDYAEAVNRLADFGFAPDHILHRADIRNRQWATAYGGTAYVPHPLANKENLLIDNLPYSGNREKTALMHIHRQNYYQTHPFFGVRDRDTDEESILIREWLDLKFKEPTTTTTTT